MPIAPDKPQSTPPRLHHRTTSTSQHIQSKQYNHDAFPIPATPTHAAIPLEYLSPTKARQKSALDQQTVQIESWLQQLFSPDPIPRHLLRWRDEITDPDTGTSTGTVSNETANDVLKALQALRDANLRADEFNRALHAARAEELELLQRVRTTLTAQPTPARALLDAITEHLSAEGREALERLSRAAGSLNLSIGFDDNDDSSNGNGSIAQQAEPLETQYLKAILNQHIQLTTLQHQLAQLVRAQKRILTHQHQQRLSTNPAKTTSTSPRLADKAAESWNDDPENNDNHEPVHARTAQYAREAKQITLKSAEYEERIGVLERQLKGLRVGARSVEEVLEMRERVEERRARVEGLEDQMRVFRGLPPDLDASRAEVKRAMAALDELKQRRARLFEQVSNG